MPPDVHLNARLSVSLEGTTTVNHGYLDGIKSIIKSMRVNLYDKGIPMISDQAYYVGDREFRHGFLDTVDAIKRFPTSIVFFSKMARSPRPGLLASSETGDLRFNTRSKNDRISADDWREFTVDRETYDRMISRSNTLGDKIRDADQENVRWAKKITLDDIDKSDRRSILSEFYRGLTSVYNPRSSIVPAYFQAEMCIQAFEALIARDALEPDQDDYKILDPTSGWGDRMVGFALAAYITKKKILYHANDMNEDLREPYARLIRKLGLIPGLSEYFTATYTIGDALELSLETIGDGEWDGIDLVFTSPPYYDMEDTIRGDVIYQTYEEWDELWFTPFVETMMNIDPYGVVMLHLANLVPRAPLIDSVKRISSGFSNTFLPRGLDWDLDYGSRPIFVFRIGE